MLNIQIPELEHKYISLYDTQEQYEADKENYEEVHYSIVKSSQATDSNYSQFQYSTRTTNNDNEVMAKYWNFETPNLWAGLKIIWGYFGWQETTIELLGETLTGGNFYNAGKNMTTVLSIPDGDTLQHIDNFTYNMRDDSGRDTISSITRIESFDTSNIKSALQFIYPSDDNNCILEQTEWDSLLRAEMYGVAPINDLHFNNIKLLFLWTTNGKNYYAPNVLYESIKFCINEPPQSPLNLSPNTSNTNKSLYTGFQVMLNALNPNTIINVTIPKSDQIKYYASTFNTDTLEVAKREFDLTSAYYTTIVFYLLNEDMSTNIDAYNITDLNEYEDGFSTSVRLNYSTETHPNTVTFNLKDYNNKIYYLLLQGGHLSNLPISSLKSGDKCYKMYNSVNFYGDVSFNLNTGDFVESNTKFFNLIFQNCTFHSNFELLNLDKVDCFGMVGTHINKAWDFKFSETIYYKYFDISNCNVTGLYDNFKINIQNVNKYDDSFYNTYEYDNDYYFFYNCPIDYAVTKAHINLLPEYEDCNSYGDISFRFTLNYTNSVTTTIPSIYINEELLNIFDVYNINIETFTQDISINFNFPLNFSTVDLSTLDITNTLKYKEEGVIKNILDELPEYTRVKHYYNQSIRLNTKNEHFIFGNIFLAITSFNIEEAVNLDIVEMVDSIVAIDSSSIIIKAESLIMTRTQYNLISEDKQAQLINYFETIDIKDYEDQ